MNLRHPVVAALARFLGVLLLGVALVAVLRAPLVSASTKVMNTLLFDHLRVQGSFGAAHARLRPEQAPGVDTAAALAIDGVTGELTLDFSLRRDLLLPMVLLLATLVAAPLPARRRGLCLAIGAPVLFAISAGSIALLILWSFAFRLRGAISWGETTRTLLDVAYRALLLPPGNRFVLPLLLATGLVLWQRQAEVRAGCR